MNWSDGNPEENARSFLAAAACKTAIESLGKKKFFKIVIARASALSHAALMRADNDSMAQQTLTNILETVMKIQRCVGAD